MAENSNDIFGQEIDEFDDLPNFVAFPRGVYLMNVTATKVDTQKEKAVKLKLELVEAVEIDKEDPQPIKEGDVTSLQYNLANDNGRAFFKKLREEMQSALNEPFSTANDFLEFFKKPVEVKLLIGKREGSKPKVDEVTGEEKPVYFNSIAGVMAS